MLQCLKCSSMSISGPHYRKGCIRREGDMYLKPVDEYLMYKCLQCGYTSNTPTNDIKNIAV